MQDRRRHQLPAPEAQAFVVCREIWHSPRTGEFMLAGPISHIPIDRFPAEVRLSVYAHVTGGHGTYPVDFVLAGPDGGAVWHWRPADPLKHPDPLMPHQLAFHDLVITVPAAGRYDLILSTAGAPIARQPLLIGPPSAFR